MESGILSLPRAAGSWRPDQFLETQFFVFQGLFHLVSVPQRAAPALQAAVPLAAVPLLACVMFFGLPLSALCFDRFAMNTRKIEIGMITSLLSYFAF